MEQNCLFNVFTVAQTLNEKKLFVYPFIMLALADVNVEKDVLLPIVRLKKGNHNHIGNLSSGTHALGFFGSFWA